MKHPRRSSLLVVSTGPPEPPVVALLDQLRAAGDTVRWGVLRGAPDGVPGVHRLRTRLPGRHLRARAVSIAGAIAPKGRAMLLAAKFDPWFQRAVRASDLVVATDAQAISTFRIAREFIPHIVTAGPDDVPAALMERLTGARLQQLLRVDDEGGAPGAARIDRICADLQGLVAERPGAPAPQPLYDFLEVLLRSERFASVSAVIGAVAGWSTWRDDPVVAGYRTVSELSLTAHTDSDLPRITAGVLERADAALAAGDDAAATVFAALALDVLFHRELHSDGLESPLVEDPAGYLHPLRDSEVGRLLTAPSGPEGSPAREVPDTRRARWRIRAMPGPFGSFYRPVVDALRQAPGVGVEVLDLRRRELGVTNLAMDPAFVRSRLDHARGRPVRGHAAARKAIAGADVLFADWADKATLIASITAPPAARFVVRIHSVDLLRPWLHLVDWSRVDALICVSPVMATLAGELLGERLEGVPVHVVPPAIDSAGFTTDKTGAAPRTLAMIGWAQRVKDPLWALEVLSRLAAEDDRWHLLLIGSDFPVRPTASGREYAAAFRRRAMSDDVRERITYIGFTDDIPRHLRDAGFVLSASRREAFQVGAAEGALSGAVPVVRDWPMLARRHGAQAVFPSEWIVGTVTEAVERIRHLSDPDAWADESARAQAAMTRLADPAGTAGRYRSIVIGETAHLADLVRGGRDEAARALIIDLLDRPDTGAHGLRQTLKACRRLGEMTLQLAAQERLLELTDAEEDRRAVRTLRGRLRETSPDWAPTIATQVAAVDPVPGRVLHVLKISQPHRQSGYSVRGWYTLNEQRRIGIDAIGVTALDFPAADISQRPLPQPEDVSGVPHHRLLRDHVPPDEPPDAYLDAWATALAPVVTQTRPSLIHVHSGHRGYEAALVALSVGRSTGVPVVYEVRGFFESLWTADTRRAERGETYERRRETETRCMREAAAVVTLSDSMREEIIGRGIDPGTVHVVPNAVDAQAFPMRPRSQELAASLGLADTFVFGYVSNLDHPREGHELLIRAATLLRERGVRATALIVGDGRRRAELEALAREVAAGDAVVFTGKVAHERVQDYYRLCDVFVVPRVRERAARLVTPLKPYEAMALGIPLIVSDLEALNEVIDHGARGTLFPADDAEALADVLDWARGHPGVVGAKADAAREWVLSERTWRANAEIYRDVYQAVTGPRRRGDGGEGHHASPNQRATDTAERDAKETDRRIEAEDGR